MGKKQITDLGGDHLTGFHDGDEPESPVTPPPNWKERPADWPPKIKYNGRHPDREAYPDPKDDPAFAHLLRPSKNDPEVLVFPPGKHPVNWWPTYRREVGAGDVETATQEQKKTPADDPTQGGDGEERVETFRALSRAFARLPPEKLAKVIEKIVKQAADGDEKAQSLVVRMESVMASKPVDTKSAALIRPENVETAEQAIEALARKIHSRYPGHACPYCGNTADYESL